MALDLFNDKFQQQEYQTRFNEWPGLRQNPLEMKTFVENLLFTKNYQLIQFLVSERTNLDQLSKNKVMALAKIVKPKCSNSHSVVVKGIHGGGYACQSRRAGSFCHATTQVI